jgi:hypothetical protein
MRIHRLIILIALLSLMSGCYFGITGRVIDSETNQPIEGAVVLVEWTVTKGYGLTYTESAKVAETLSDKDGNFDLPGCYNPFANKPDVTVYKKGYVAWNNNFIFPRYEKRMDFKWVNGYVFKLEKFKDIYSHNDHVSFLRSSIAASQNLEAKGAIYNAFEWERYLAQQERVKKGLSP